ncbi:MAG: hypothetical protein ACK2T3_11450, partial [Candidatus Promineifilaceae bacterium]
MSLSSAEALKTAAPFENGLEEIFAAIAYIDLRIRWAVARARTQGLDPKDEFRGLYITEDQIDDLLSQDLGHALWPSGNGHEGESEKWPQIIDEAKSIWLQRTEASKNIGIELRLDDLRKSFGLTDIEVEILLTAMAPEVDPGYRKIFAYLQDDVTKKRPSVDLILSLLTTSFRDKLKLRHHFTDEGRLVSSRLVIHFAGGMGSEPTLLEHFIRPAGRVVEHLLGFPGLDARLLGAATLVDASAELTARSLPAKLRERLNHVVDKGKQNGSLPMLSFLGGYGVGKRAAARYISHRLECPLILLDLKALGTSSVGLVEGLHYLIRDGLLLGANIFISHWDDILEDYRPPDNIFYMLVTYPGLVIMAGEKEWQPKGEERTRRILRVSFGTTDYQQRLESWQRNLDGRDLQLQELANQFQFSPGQIEDAVATALDFAQWRQEPLCEVDLFAASRAHS